MHNLTTLSFLFSFFQEFAHLLLHTTGNGDAARARVLQHTTKGVKGTEQRDDILCHTMHHHNGIGGVHLDDTSLETADGT